MKYRDLNLIPWDSMTYLVISCDSSGGIGNKSKDVVKTSSRNLGFYTAQVALMEMLSIKVMPMVLSNTLAVEMKDTGAEILQGILDALNLLGLAEKVEITGSTEENISTCSTGMGITLMGKVGIKDWIHPRTLEKDLAVVAGLPKVGEMVIDSDDSKQFSLKVLKKLLDKKYIHELIPGGSKGIIHEINELEVREKLVFRNWNNNSLDLNASCGPATSALITIHKEDLGKLREDLDIPMFIVGEFVAEDEKEQLWEM